jgi:2,4-dienoyl-CoA reductase [(3E)-enoyl-CoA-producing], mitochondrial
VDVLQATAAEISASSGNPVLALQADVRDPESVRKAVDELVAKWGLPDVIVNNAAGNFVAPTERLSPNAFKTIIDTVLNGSAHGKSFACLCILEADAAGCSDSGCRQAADCREEAGGLFVGHDDVCLVRQCFCGAVCVRQGWRRGHDQVRSRVGFLRMPADCWFSRRSLAAEWGRHGLRFVGIAPGPIETKVCDGVLV